MKRMNIFSLSLLIVTLFMMNCSGSGSNSAAADALAQMLRGNTFTLEGMDEVLNNDCGSRSETISTAGSVSISLDNDSSISGDEELLPISAGVQASGGTSVASDDTVTFDNSDFTIGSNGNEVMSGTWLAVDGNTIYMIIDGVATSIDLIVDEDEEVIEIVDVLFDCSTFGGSTISPSPQDSAPLGNPVEDSTENPNISATDDDSDTGWDFIDNILEPLQAHEFGEELPGGESENFGNEPNISA